LHGSPERRFAGEHRGEQAGIDSLQRGNRPKWQFDWRPERLEGKTLSSADTLENTPQPDAVEATIMKVMTTKVTITTTKATTTRAISMARF